MMTQTQATQVFLMLLGLLNYAQSETEAVQLELAHARMELIQAEHAAEKARLEYYDVVDELMRVRDERETLQAKSFVSPRLLRCA